MSTNAQGLRGRREFAVAKTPGRLRIAVLGDSFTFGEEINDDETFPAILQRLLPRAEVLNMGVSGYGHDQMLALLEDRWPLFRPDVVALCFVKPDRSRNLLSFRDYAKIRYVVEGDRLRLTGRPVPDPDETLSHHRWGWRLLDLAALLRDLLFPSSPPDPTALILDELRRFVQSHGGKTLLFYAGRRPESGSSPEAAFLHDYCARRGLSCPEFLLDDSKTRGKYGHWSPTENLQLAEDLARVLPVSR